MLGAVHPLVLPSPLTVASAFVREIMSGSLLVDALFSLRRLGIGYFIGVSLGVPAGVVVGASTRLKVATDFPVDFLRSLPVTSLLPMFLFLWGVGEGGRIAVVIYAVGLLVFFNTVVGVQSVSLHRKRVAALLGASRAQMFVTVLVPEALPQIVVGLRLGISAAFVYTIVTEMFFGSVRGLGYRIFEANLNYDSPLMYAAIFLTGILGYALNHAIVRLEERFVHWKGR